MKFLRGVGVVARATLTLLKNGHPHIKVYSPELTKKGKKVSHKNLELHDSRSDNLPSTNSSNAVYTYSDK
jgi:hypothetical protein